MIGRLKPGATREQAQSQVDALNARNLELVPAMKDILINAGFNTKVVRLRDQVVRDIRGTLLLLWGGVVFVLLIGALNVANLFLARAAVRLREVATRLALGAGPWQMARQLVAESLVLSTTAAALGLLLGYWALRPSPPWACGPAFTGRAITLGAETVVFVIVVSLVVGLAVGVIPLVHALRTDASAVFHGEGRTGSAGRAARLWRKGLVAAQVSFALVLLMGAGLLFASFRHVLAVKPGFATTQVAHRHAHASQVPLSRGARPARVPGEDARAGAGAARGRGRGGDGLDPPRRLAKRQRDPRRGLRDAARRVARLAAQRRGHSRVLRGDGDPAPARAGTSRTRTARGAPP